MAIRIVCSGDDRCEKRIVFSALDAKWEPCKGWTRKGDDFYCPRHRPTEEGDKRNG